jgi:heat-inducible transcriptional repressor
MTTQTPPFRIAAPGEPPGSALASLDRRSRDIFRRIVESYLDSGEPIGSRNISRNLPVSLSPASVRNIMADLEQLGLIYAPHTSAGRLPTELGLRFFVDALLEVGDLRAEERQQIEAQLRATDRSRTLEGVLSEASQALSGLSRGAGVVLANKADMRLKHIEFVRIEPTRALVVLVGEDGSVENRLVDLDVGTTQSTLIEAGNYLNTHLRGRTLAGRS